MPECSCVSAVLAVHTVNRGGVMEIVQVIRKKICRK